MPDASSLFARYGAMPLLKNPATATTDRRPATGVNWWKTLQRIWQYLARYRLRLAVVIATVLASAVLILLAPWLLGVAIDGLLIDSPTTSPLLLIILLALVYLAQLGTTLLQNHWMIGIAQRAVAAIRQDVFARLHDLPIPYYSGRNIGEITSRLTNDLDNVGQTLSQAVLRITTSLVVFFGMLLLMFWLNPLLTLVSLVVVPMMFFGLRWISARTPLLVRQQQRDMGDFSGFAEEALSVQPITKAFAREEETLARFLEKNRQLHVSSYWAQTYSGFVSKIMYICDNMSFAVILGVGGLMAIKGMVTIGIIITFSEYARQFSRQLNQVSTQINTVLAAMAGAERAFEILDEKEEDDGHLELEKLHGDIRFENVTFRYGPGRPVLSGLDLHIAPGQMLALVGSTGAGKSTVVQLVTRFHDVDEGCIRIDGHDIRDIRRASLRRRMGFVLQDSLLFNTTVRENVRYGRPDADDAEVEKACRLANAHDFIAKLPQGYDTLIRQESSDLSHGQQQLLTIARAILADPVILILDEATSSIDTLTEIRIQQALARLMKGRSCLVIAHRLNTIHRADHIIVLDQGRVVEQGTHASLLAQQGMYHSLYREQSQ